MAVLLGLVLVVGVPAVAKPATSGLVAAPSSGQIEREDLHPGLSQLVREESIGLANSAGFEAAREAWDADDDFVFQVDYQMEFRSKVDFMSSAPGHVADLLFRRPANFGSQEMNLYMSEDEVSEMKRRDLLGDRMEDLVLELTGVPRGVRSGIREDDRPDYGPNFGGIWQDQLDGGRIVVAVVNRNDILVEVLEGIAGGAGNLRIVEQPFSYNDLEIYRDRLEDQLLGLGLPPHVAAVWGPGGRRLEVTVEDPAAVDGRIGEDVPGEAFSIVEGIPFHDAGLPGTTHSLADQQAGLRIRVFDGSGSMDCT